MRFNHINIDKLSICFTWDDNCLAHSSILAPEFLDRGLRCTFYINPGLAGFQSFLPHYKRLSEERFEIGSHGFRHDNYSDMTLDGFERELEKAASSITEHIGVYPSTFAFPYHDFNEETLGISKKFHLETRNTLKNSKRYAVRSASTLEDMLLFINGCISDDQSMVFSGHSAVTDAAGSGAPPEDPGYEPISLRVLWALLDRLQALRDDAEILTFEQAALKQYIIDNCEISGDSYSLTEDQAFLLNKFGINAHRLSLLI